MDYPYDRQNARGRIKGEGRGAAKFTRTITNRARKIEGVVYHPYNEEGQVNDFVRAQEFYPAKPARAGRR